MNEAIKDPQRRPESSKLGEIDTAAPFQSVKAAVSLFGESTTPRGRTTVRKSRLSSENVLDKETQLLLAQKELKGIKESLESAQSLRTQALADLGTAKRTVSELSERVETLKMDKRSITEAKTEVSEKEGQLELMKSNGSALNQELDAVREQYRSCTREIDNAKKVLSKLRDDLSGTMEAKDAALRQAEEAEHMTRMNQSRVSELSKEIAERKDVIQQLRYKAAENEIEVGKISKERENLTREYEAAVRYVEMKLETLKQEQDVKRTEVMGVKLEDTTKEMEGLRKEMLRAKDDDTSVMQLVNDEINEALSRLEVVAAEESRVRALVKSLRTELDDVRREHGEAAKAAERMDRDWTKKTCDAQKHEKRDTELKIKLSSQEFEDLKWKAEGWFEKMEKETSDAMAEVEKISARKSEIDKQIEEKVEAIKEMKNGVETALKTAEMAEAAQRAVEAELLRRRQEEIA